MKKRVRTIACLAAASGAALLTAMAAPSHGCGPSSGITIQTLAAGSARFPYVRTPALAVTTKGTLIAAYDPRYTKNDLPSHMPLVIRRSTDGGRVWGSERVVRSGPAPDGYSDPSLLVDRRTGRIFLFYAASVNRGFADSGTGNSDTDPDILQADVSYSDDDGVTWRNEVITDQIKSPTWNGIFAASGAGIQLTTGAYAGRLVQQYVIGYQGAEYAASAYSDDDGATWHMGHLVGPGMNENKTVELADGRLLLDVRATPDRLLAVSDDGGMTYTRPVANPQLADPGDNGSIIRYAPHARVGGPRSRCLLESNDDSRSQRTKLVIKMSCDDGETWPVTKVVDRGSAGYSTLVYLPDGHFGLLFERDHYTKVAYAAFGPLWLGRSCAAKSDR